MALKALHYFGRLLEYLESLVGLICRSTLDFLFPKACVICDEQLIEDSFCSSCWRGLELLDYPACPRCYFQFPFELDLKCEKCEKKKYYCDAIRSPIRYNETAKLLILKFKNNRQIYLSSLIARMMLRILPGFEFDCVVAVPLHPLRHIWRGYNQAELLAQEISKITGAFDLSYLLIRKRFTYSQKYFGKLGRANNLKDAFEVRGSFDGMKVLLIDDVCTTGATIEECSKQLKIAGAEKVYCITAAMT